MLKLKERVVSKRKYKSNNMTAADMKLNKAICEKIKEARLSRIVFINNGSIETFGKKKYCTQTELAKVLKVSFQQIQKYEKGTNGISSIKLIQISNFFGKTLEYFTCGANELLWQYNLPDNNPDETLAPTMVAGLN